MKMRKFIKISAIAAVLAAAVSCDLNKAPVFTDEMSFAAFDVASMTVAESGKKVSIPVTIASLEPVKVSVAFKVLADDSFKAVEGKDFKLADDSGVLVFDGKQRTANIDIDIFPRTGEFTGDLKFALQLESAGTLNIGHENVCVVTIQDEDHPLAFILGDYAVSADSYFSNIGHFDWTITIVKDPEDINVVWFHNIDPYFYSYNFSAANGFNIFYGNVSEDKKSIVIPQGQELGYEATKIVGLDAADPDESGDDFTDVYLTISEDGSTITFEKAFGIEDDGFWNLFAGPVVMTKK